jgi:hypothetical protein
VTTGFGSRIWVNGQSNDYLKALQLGKHYTGSNKFLMLHNQTSSGFMDSIESALDKLSGATPVSKDVAAVLALVDPTNHVYAHSQGTILVRNAVNMAGLKGADLSGFVLNFDGAAVNKLSTNLNFKILGRGPLSSYNTHSLDAVPNVIGYNSITMPNPVRFTGSILASPLLSVGGDWSPHTYRNGGSHLRWVPDFY